MCSTSFLFYFIFFQALEEALNLHSPSSSQQPPGPGNFADAANNLKKQELLTQIAVLKEQARSASQNMNIYTLKLNRFHSVCLMSPYGLELMNPSSKPCFLRPRVSLFILMEKRKIKQLF